MQHPKGNADARRVFCEKITQYEEDGRSIVYIDESGFAHDMPRTHGYAPKGERCHGSHDRQARGRINVIGALLAGVLQSVGLTEANVDADIFNLWLIGDLLPKLPPRVVLVMDRATFHRRADTQALSHRRVTPLNISRPTVRTSTKSNINGLKPRPAGGKPGCPSTKYSKTRIGIKIESSGYTWTTAFGGSPCRPPEPPNASHDTRRRRHPACNPATHNQCEFTHQNRVPGPEWQRVVSVPG